MKPEELFNSKIEAVLFLINSVTDQLWAANYPSYPKDHSLKKVLKASVILAVQQKMTEELTFHNITGGY